MKIGIFDSGVGGITVLEEIYKMLPNEDYIYFGDSFNAPYGDKSNDELRTFTNNIIDFLLKNDVKIIVIACNTVTSFMYQELVNKLDIPVIGVIFPTVEYVNNLHIKNVGVIATERTITNNTYQKLINKKVFALATKEFVPMIEDGSYVNKTSEIHQILKPLLDNNIHALVLGCTHYPFLKNQLEKIYGGIIIDSGVVTAFEVKSILQDHNALENNGSVEIYVSGDVSTFENVIKDFVSFDYVIKNQRL